MLDQIASDDLGANFDLAEFALYSGARSGPDITLVQNYLAAKWTNNAPLADVPVSP
jgi:hypothetical protein